MPDHARTAAQNKETPTSGRRASAAQSVGGTTAAPAEPALCWPCRPRRGAGGLHPLAAAPGGQSRGHPAPAGQATVGPVADRHEQEADRVAEQVLGQPVRAQLHRRARASASRARRGRGPDQASSARAEEEQLQATLLQRAARRGRRGPDQASASTRRPGRGRGPDQAPAPARPRRGRGPDQAPAPTRPGRGRDPDQAPASARPEEEEEVQTKPLLQRARRRGRRSRQAGGAGRRPTAASRPAATWRRHRPGEAGRRPAGAARCRLHGAPLRRRFRRCASTPAPTRRD